MRDSKKYPTYNHPTGVKCLTFAGFLMAEADTNGRTVEEEYDALREEISADEAEETLRLSDPSYARETINSEVRFLRKECWKSLRHSYARGRSPERDDFDFLNAFAPYVESIEEVLVASPGSFMSRKSETYILAVATRNGGVRDIVEFSSWSSPGSFYEPPDGETWVEWHGLPHTRKDDRIGTPCPCERCASLKDSR